MKYRTKTGRMLTTEDIEALAAEAEAGYDLSTAHPRPVMKRCSVCNRVMDTGSPTDVDCGGDCAFCMAYLFNDPDERRALDKWRKGKAE